LLQNDAIKNDLSASHIKNKRIIMLLGLFLDQTLCAFFPVLGEMFRKNSDRQREELVELQDKVVVDSAAYVKRLKINSFEDKGE
jgi:hypothetical protein